MSYDLKWARFEAGDLSPHFCTLSQCSAYPTAPHLEFLTRPKVNINISRALWHFFCFFYKNLRVLFNKKLGQKVKLWNSITNTFCYSFYIYFHFWTSQYLRTKNNILLRSGLYPAWFFGCQQDFLVVWRWNQLSTF